MGKKIMRSLDGYQIADMEARSYLSKLLMFTPAQIGAMENGTNCMEVDGRYCISITLDKEIDPFAIWYQVSINGVNHNCYPGEKKKNGTRDLIDENGDVVAVVSGLTAAIYSDSVISSASISEAVEGSGRAKSGANITDVYLDDQYRIHIEMEDGSTFVTTSIYGAAIDEVLVQDNQPVDPGNKLWISDGAAEEIAVPTYEEYQNLKTEVDMLGDLTGVANTWQLVQWYVRTGKASEHFAIGDELVCNYRYQGQDYDFTWVVADIDREVTLSSGEKRNALILQSKYATIETLMFDKKEIIRDITETTAKAGWTYCDGNGDTINVKVGDPLPVPEHGSLGKYAISKDVALYGYNRYSHSAVRQWLNSVLPAGSWWSEQHFGDIEPSEHYTLDGFMLGLEKDFLNVVCPVAVTTMCNNSSDVYETGVDVTYDFFWLPSKEEVFGVPDQGNGLSDQPGDGVEGTVLPYWRLITGADKATDDALVGRTMTTIADKTTPCKWMLRSANRLDRHLIWGVVDYSPGALRLDFADELRDVARRHCAPVCAIC